MTLPGRVDVSHAAAGPCRLQLCAVLGSPGIKLSAEQYTVRIGCVGVAAFPFAGSAVIDLLLD
jgi:hypothetical protein